VFIASLTRGFVANAAFNSLSFSLGAKLFPSEVPFHFDGRSDAGAMEAFLKFLN